MNGFTVSKQKKMNEIRSIYGSVLAGSGDDMYDVKSGIRMTVFLKETISITRMQKAADMAVQKCPYVTYTIIRKGRICYYVNNKAHITVLNDIPEKFGTDVTDGCFLAIGVSGKRLDVYYSHALMDGTAGKWFVNSLLEYYYNDQADVSEEKPYDVYGIDLMGQPLDIADDYQYKNYFKRPIFSFTDETDSEKEITFLLELDKNSVDNLIKKENAPLSHLIFYYMAVLILRFHPDNENLISCKMPVDTRSFFGAEGSFQNSSIPNLFFQIDPKEVSTDTEVFRICREQKKQQLVRDHLAYITNIFGTLIRDGIHTDDVAEFVDGLRQGLMISNMGKFISDDISDHVDMTVVRGKTLSDIAIYISNSKDRYFICVTQSFGDMRYVDGITELFEANGVKVYKKGQLL